MNDMVLKIMLSLITILGAIVTGVLVPWFKSKTTKEQRDDLVFWTKVAVQAFEKWYEKEHNAGSLKKADVVEFIIGLGFDMDAAQLSLLVDAVVEEVINKPAKELEILSLM